MTGIYLSSPSLFPQTTGHWRPAVEAALDVNPVLLNLAFHLFRSAFRLLGFVASQFSNLLLNFASYVLDIALHLIAIHDVLLIQQSVTA